MNKKKTVCSNCCLMRLSVELIVDECNVIKEGRLRKEVLKLEAYKL